MPHSKGWRVDPPDLRDLCPTSQTIQEILSPFKTGEHKPIELPIVVDNRAHCTPIRDQGRLGSCVAFSCCGMYEYLEKKTHGKFIEGSELFVYKMARYVMKLHGESDGTGDTGAYLRSGVGALAHFGMPPEVSDPYEIDKFDNIPGPEIFSIAKDYQILKYFRLDPYTEPQKNLDLIRSWLAKGFATVFGFSCYNSVLNQAETTGAIPYPTTQDTISGGHAVVTVGYDNNKVISNSDNGKSTTGAFLIRNSWSENWGEKGYGWIPYEYLLSGQGLAQDFWCVIKMEWLDSDLFHW